MGGTDAEHVVSPVVTGTWNAQFLWMLYISIEVLSGFMSAIKEGNCHAHFSVFYLYSHYSIFFKMDLV